ncbi:MAG: hypothetical protein ABJF10_00065 [Chthoniobacter sp.]|uniref:hypothetical protein n=1 Tax=Chthoniobacter sp. TaxID=2510640 RepID=UPI0032AB013A
MNEEQFKPIIRQWFEHSGFRVTDIPTDETQTPDFHITKDCEGYALELKIKGDDPDELAEDSAVLQSGQILERSIPLSPRNRLGTIIREGYGQIKTWDPQSQYFHVLWVHCTGRDAIHLRDRFRRTIFGQQGLFSTDQPDKTEAFYFRESSFWRHRNGLDGILLSLFEGSNFSLQLCVNTVSLREAAFRKSHLFDLHKNGLYDPRALERDSGVLIADCDLARDDESAILAFLREKYSLEHLQTWACTKLLFGTLTKTEGRACRKGRDGERWTAHDFPRSRKCRDRVSRTRAGDFLGDGAAGAGEELRIPAGAAGDGGGGGGGAE